MKMRTGIMVQGILALMSVMWAGCATEPAKPSAENIGKLNRDQGLLYGTYSRRVPKERYSSEMLLIRAVGKHDGMVFRNFDARIWINSMPLVANEYDFNDDSECGSLFAFSLKEGDYEIYDYQMEETELLGSYEVNPGHPFSIRFHVTAGKAVYLGDIRMQRNRTGPFMGLHRADVPCFFLSDKFNRDTLLLKNRYPTLSLEPIDGIPAKEASDDYFSIE